MALPIANAGANQRFTFASLPTLAALTGSGTFFAPATAISSYLWELVEKPVGSAAALSSTVVQNPTLNTIDTPGTYLLFLRVTDDTAQQSEGDKLKADASAFVSIRAELTEGLVKPAPSERDHADMLLEWADDIDANETLLDGHRTDFTDPHRTLSSTGAVGVSNVPAGAGEVLTSTGASAAAWGAPSAAADASTGTKGVTYLAEAAVAPASPKAVTRDRSRLTFLINDSYTASGWEPGHVTVQTTTGNHNRCHAVAFIEEDTRIKTYDAAFLDGGLISGGGYTVDLVRMTPAQFLADTVTDVIGTTNTGAPASDNAPLSDTGNAVGVDFSGGNYVGIYVTAGSGGSGLCVTVHMEKRW